MNLPPSFRDENRPMQELARELALLREHNLRFKDGDPQGRMLLFAEGAIAILALEHFVRIVVGTDAPERADLHNLLQIAVKNGWIRMPWEDQQEGIRKVCRVRNTILHANYAQAAMENGCASVADYFRTGKFASEVEAVFHIADYMMRQIDPATGRPYRQQMPP